MTLEAASALRADEALHLACADKAGAKAVAALDGVMANHAHCLKIKQVKFS